LNNASLNHRKILALRTGRPVNGGRLLTRCAPVPAALADLLAHTMPASASVLDGAPANLSARAVDGAVVLVWEPPAGAEPTGYRILRRYATDPAELSVVVADTGSAGTRYIDRTARPGTEAAGDRARHRAQAFAPAVIALKDQAMLGLTIMLMTPTIMT
jgi:hypothetical protein